MTHKKDNIIIGILAILTFIIIFSTFDKYWAPFDEGIVTVASELLLKGKVPYKDFFLINYPPGQVYALALLYRIFGVSIDIGRLYTVFIQLALAMLVFLICKLLIKKLNISILIWFICLTCLGPRLGTIPSPIWPSMTFALLSLYLFGKYIEIEENRYLIYCALSVGTTSIFRHDIGIFLFLGLFLSILLYQRINMDILIFTAFSIFLPLSLFSYLISKNAASDIINSLVLFPFIHEKTASLPFPKPCFDLNMIFHGSLHFININQYYLPILIYAYMAIFLVAQFVKNKKFDKTNVSLSALSLFGVLSFNQPRIRTDPAHLLTVIYPVAILFGFMLDKTINHIKVKERWRHLHNFFIISILFLFLLLVIKNIDKYFKNAIKKPLIKSTVQVDFSRGRVYIPGDEVTDIKGVLSYISDNTRRGEYIYIGNIASGKDDFGGSLILYTLCDRLPSTKYYEILPGLMRQIKVQEEIISSLKQNKVTYIVLQDVDIPSDDIDATDNRKTILDNYLYSNFVRVEKFGKYNIFKKI